jgi:hypothetical protein
MAHDPGERRDADEVLGRRPVRRIALLIETSNGYSRQLLAGVYEHMRSDGHWATFLPEHGRGMPPLKELARWTGDGIIDRSLTIPARLIRRSVNLEVAVRATGNPGRCGDHLPIALRIDPASTVQVGTANPPIPRGFQSFPQALMPRIDFGIGEDAFADTVRAACQGRSGGRPEGERTGRRRARPCPR